MVNVLLDVSSFSKDWFKDVIRQLEKAKGVKFLYSQQAQYKSEVVKVPQLARFLVEMRDKGRRVDAAAADVQSIVDELEGHPVWIANKKSCDDPHLFAILKVGRGKYLFTDEKRLTSCRGCLSAAKIDLCSFKAIRSSAVFKKNRSKIFKS